MDLFEKYKELYVDLRKKYKTDDNIPRELRLFDIKLRLVLGIKNIEFDTNIAYVKSKEVNICYNHLIKLTQLWNVFEALFEYLDTIYKMDKKENNKIEKMLKNKELTSLEVASLLKNSFFELKELYKKKNFPEDFNEYYKRASLNIKKTNKNALDNIKQNLENGTENNVNKILYLLYIDRNIFYHTAEAVKIGMSYSNRKKYLYFLYKMLKNYILSIAIILLEKEI